MATHWQRAGDLDACRAWAERADDEARAAAAHEDAVRFARLALDSAAGAGPAERARLLLRLAEALALADRVEDALDACTEAADLADAAGRPDLLARAALVVHGSGNPRIFSVVPPICERALARLPPDEFALRARLLAQIAVGYGRTRGRRPSRGVGFRGARRCQAVRRPGRRTRRHRRATPRDHRRRDRGRAARARSQGDRARGVRRAADRRAVGAPVAG